MTKRHKKIITIGIAAALVAALLAYWLYREHQKRVLHDTVVAWVMDAGSRLGSALAVDPGSAADSEEDTIKLLDAHVDAVARNLTALRALDGSLQQTLVDAADHYLLAVQEILRQHAASRRHRHRTSVGLRELWEYMQSRYTQGPEWTTEALRRKELLEREYFQYRIASDALARLLSGYAGDRARVAPLVDAARLPDERATQAARERSIKAARQMGAEMDRLRRLPRQP